MKTAQTILLLGIALLAGAGGSRGADTSYRQLGYQYLSPIPGAEYTSPQTRFVLVRFSNISPAQLTNLSQFIRVTGASSGNHSGATRIAGDNRTVIFQMSTDFIAHELVTVSLAPGLASATIPPYQYQFMISGYMPAGAGASIAAVTPFVPKGPAGSASQPSPGLATAGGKDREHENNRRDREAEISLMAISPRPANESGAQALITMASPGKSGLMPNGVSVPSDFPHVTITTNNNPDSGYIFLDNRGGNGKPYNVIFDNTGSPIWYMRMPDERRDMKVQRNGMLTMLARTGGYRFVGLNTNYQEVANYRAVNGYGVDEHELVVLADGTYFLIGLRTETVDMSRYIVGGKTAASVTEQVLQQFTSEGELVFQWRSWDNFDILGQRYFIDLTANSFDFSHINSIDVDTDRHILISSRNNSECTKINRDTGEVIWRLGGMYNQFTFVNDPLNGPCNQHALRLVGTNRYTLFDNGNSHSPSVSRAVEYELNPGTMTATVVWQYPATPTSSLFSWYMGNAQRLPNGNTLINWALGNLPKLTEVRPDGTKAFEMNWVNQYEAYRVWRCPWTAVALKPYLIVEAYPDNVTLLFNQFGDTNVVSYRIYGGTSPSPTTLLATSETTMKRLTGLQSGQRYYFRIRAVNVNGVEGAYSNEENVMVNIFKPGQNMVVNGDFSANTDSWIWSVSGSATATWRVTNAVSRFDITNGGTSTSSVQLRQAGIPLIQGNKYVFEFDGWSDLPRYIEAKVGQDVSPYINYSGIGNSYLTPNRTHYRYVFTMQQASDFSCRAVFNLGTSGTDLNLDNVSLFNAPPGDFNLDGRVDLNDLSVMTADWLKQQTDLVPDLDASGKVDFKDFSILGESWYRP